jgi:hypothetical protein
MKAVFHGFAAAALALCVALGFASCERVIGWGVLLWSTEDPEIPSGTVLPVYIRSNIEQVYVVGVPKAFQNPARGLDKFEIPLSHLRMVGKRRAAENWAESFTALARTYAENLQDGLPIREDPDNSASSRRVYRLKTGQIIKVLEKAQGNPAISTTGDPLPGDWYKVLTGDGATGYCFSYRLRFFEHQGGPLNAAAGEEAETEDADLEQVLARNWYPESYGTMVNSSQIDIDELANRYQFLPGQDTGLARLYLSSLDRTFSYTAIRRDRARSWHFEGTTLQMTLRQENLLAVQFADDAGALRTYLFVTLPTGPDDIAAQELERRETLFRTIFDAGPVFTSSNYGALTFTPAGRFIWQGNSLLVPNIIPAATLNSGAVEMRLYLSPSLSGAYTGAFTLRFDGAGRAGAQINFLYLLEEQGLRIEYVDGDNLTGLTVARRSASPTVIYFYRSRG